MRATSAFLSLALSAGLSAPAPVPAQEIPDTILAEGVPAIPKELAGELNRYQNIRSASLQDWVPGRREILILTRFADTTQVHRVAFPGGDRRQLTFFDERVTGVRSRPGAPEFAFAMDEGGAENFQFYLQGLRAGTADRLTDGRSRNISPSWSDSGKLLAYSSNARNGKDMDLYVVDPASPSTARRVKEVSGNWEVADWSPDGRRFAAVEFISIAESYVHLIDVASGETQTLTPRPAAGAPTVLYGAVLWSKDGKALYWTTNEGSEFQRLARYDLTTKKSRPLTAHIPCDVEEFDLSDDGRTIALVANEDGIGKLHVLDAATGRERPAPKVPVGQIFDVKFRPRSQEFAFTLNSARSSSDVYSFDLATGKLVRWTESETGGLDPSGFSEPELIHYGSFDGKEIPAFLYRPPAKFQPPYPVLINIHGGPESQFQPGFLGRTNYLLNELGIAIVYPNVRGSSGYGKTYLTLDNGIRREDSVKDIGALLDWIAKQSGLDASRVAVAGGSYGGYMSLATMTHYSDRLRAGIDIVGISSFVTFLQNTQDYRRDLRRAEYGDERVPEMRAHLEKISPLTNVAKIGRPMLIVQGKNDPRVPVTEAEQMLAAVRKNRVPVWYVLGKNEGHGFAKKQNQDYLQFAQILFLKEHLLAGKSPT